jgi:predicted PurR-regulated permease PerM
MKQNIEVKLESAQKFIDNKFETPKEEKGQLLDAQLTDIFSSVGGFFTSFLFSIGSFITNLFIVAFYAFFFLNYRKRCKIFITGFISRKYKSGSSNVFNRIAGVANNYISGVFLVVIILSIINTIGLTIIGIEHALFFGVLAGLLNIIPFAGSLVGSLIPVSFVLFTQQSWFYPITVAIFFLVVQTVESYLLTPNITGNKIKLNPLATITALLLGGLIWGIAGMILFVPYLGIAKVIFNHIEELRPFSYFIGIEKEEQ